MRQFSSNNLQFTMSFHCHNAQLKISASRIQGEVANNVSNKIGNKFGRNLTFGRGFLVECNIGQKSNNHSKRKSYRYFGININKINHGFNPFLNLIALNKQTIPNIRLAVNNANLLSSVVFEKGIPKAIINHPADKLTSKSDNVMLTTGSILIRNILAHKITFLHTASLSKTEGRKVLAVGRVLIFLRSRYQLQNLGKEMLN